MVFKCQQEKAVPMVAKRVSLYTGGRALKWVRKSILFFVHTSSIHEINLRKKKTN